VSQPRDDRQDDLFGPSLDQIINLRHPLVRLAAEIDWALLAGRFSPVCRIGPGQPPLPTRLVAALLILKHMHNLSDETLCDRWVENPYFLIGGLIARTRYGERDRHVDLAHAAFLTCRDLLNAGHRA
jgi:Transposase domain (DUF772)